MSTQLGFVLHFQGKSTQNNRILWDDLAQFVSHLDAAARRIINVTETGRGVKTGRPSKAFQAATALEVVGVVKGSFGLELSLRREQDLLPGFDAGQDAFSKLIMGLERVGESGSLPDGFDEGVLRALREAGKVLDRGIDSVRVVATLGTRPEVVYDWRTRERIIMRLRRPEKGWAEVQGRLIMEDVPEGALRCRITPPNAPPVICSFDEDLYPEVHKLMRQVVHVRGEAVVDTATQNILSLRMQDIEAIQEESGTPILVPQVSGFWQSKDMEQLAAEQGVRPIEDWDSFVGGWPEDADFDSFMEALRSARGSD